MAAIQNERDLILIAAGRRVEPVFLPPGVIIGSDPTVQIFASGTQFTVSGGVASPTSITLQAIINGIEYQYWDPAVVQWSLVSGTASLVNETTGLHNESITIFGSSMTSSQIVVRLTVLDSSGAAHVADKAINRIVQFGMSPNTLEGQIAAIWAELQARGEIQSAAAKSVVAVLDKNRKRMSKVDAGESGNGKT